MRHFDTTFTFGNACDVMDVDEKYSAYYRLWAWFWTSLSEFWRREAKPCELRDNLYICLISFVQSTRRIIIHHLSQEYILIISPRRNNKVWRGTCATVITSLLEDYMDLICNLWTQIWNVKRTFSVLYSLKYDFS